MDPKRPMTAVDAASRATRLAILLLLSVLLFSKALLGELLLGIARGAVNTCPTWQALLGELPPAICPGVFPAGIFVMMVAVMLLPRGRAAAFASTLLRVLAAPFYPVDLWSTFVGDVLTSLVKPLQDLVYRSSAAATQ